MSRFYERSDKEKGGWRAEREGEVEDRGEGGGGRREKKWWGQKEVGTGTSSGFITPDWILPKNIFYCMKCLSSFFSMSQGLFLIFKLLEPICFKINNNKLQEYMEATSVTSCFWTQRNKDPERSSLCITYFYRFYNMLLFNHSKFKLNIDLYHDVEHVFHLTYIGKHFILASCGRFSPSCVHPHFLTLGWVDENREFEGAALLYY